MGNIKYFIDFLYLIFYACLRIRFLVVETNPDLRRPVPTVCGILCRNVRGLAGNLSDLTNSSSQYTVVLRVFVMRYASGVGVAGSRILSPCLVVPEQDASGPRDGCICTRWLQIILRTQIRV